MFHRRVKAQWVGKSKLMSNTNNFNQSNHPPIVDGDILVKQKWKNSRADSRGHLSYWGIKVCVEKMFSPKPGQNCHFWQLVPCWFLSTRQIIFFSWASKTVLATIFEKFRQNILSNIKARLHLPKLHLLFENYFVEQRRRLLPDLPEIELTMASSLVIVDFIFLQICPIVSDVISVHWLLYRSKGQIPNNDPKNLLIFYRGNNVRLAATELWS